jgi:hypothetical protein
MISPTPRWSLALVLLASLASLAACGDDDVGDDVVGDDTPLYLAASWVADDSGTNTYVAVLDSLDQDPDFTDAIEVPGYGDAWVFDEWVFVAEGESPIVTRYTLGADGALAYDTEISFLDHGLSAAAFFDNQILSRTKAYMANVAMGEYVAWNPETMEILGTVPWPEFELDEGLAAFHSYVDRGGEVIDGKFFHGIYQHDEAFESFGGSSVVGVYDIETDELLATIDVPCPMMDVASPGADGYLYLSGWSYMPLSAELGLSETNCAARIDTETLELDADWTLEWSDALDGEEGMGLRVVDGATGTLAVFHGSGVDPMDAASIWDLDVGTDDWEIYDIDLASRELTATGTTMDDGSFYDTHLDGRYFVYLPGVAGTDVLELVDGAYQRRFSALGWMSRLFRLR